MKTILFIAVLASAGCLRKTEYKCTETPQCGAGGVCEDTGFCSFPDGDCPSGRRYGDFSSATYSGTCVGGENIDVDGGVDGPGIDAMVDGMMGNCPATYTTTIGTHKYRVVTAAATWPSQVAACAADGTNAYLAVPDDQAELTAIIAASTAALTWVGIHDETTEGTYATVKGGTLSAASPLWDTNNNEPDNQPSAGGGQADCVSAVKAVDRLADDKCGATFPAVCECEP